MPHETFLMSNGGEPPSLSLFSPILLSNLSNPLSLFLSPFFIPITTFHTRPCPIPCSIPLFISLYLRSFVDTYSVLPSASISPSRSNSAIPHPLPSPRSSLHSSFFSLYLSISWYRGGVFEGSPHSFVFRGALHAGVNDRVGRRGAIARCCVECRITSGRGAINARIMFNIARLSGLAT